MALDLSGILGTVDFIIAGNSIDSFITAIAVFLIAFAVFRIFKYFFIGRLKSLFSKTKNQIDDLIINVIDSVGWPFYLYLAFYLAIQFLVLTDTVSTILHYLMIILVIIYTVKAFGKVIDYSTYKIVNKEEDSRKIDSSAGHVLSLILKGVVWLLAFLAFVAVLGVNITPAIAGLGVGGIAVAFAMQNILSDLFSSFSIYFDKPFMTGDFIIIGDDMGTVQKIGLKSTRIQTLQGEELVVSNRELTETRIHNYKKMKKRRIVFTFGVTYDTPTKKLEKIPGIVREIMGKIKLADLNRAHFKKFGDFSLDYEVVYYLDSGDYNIYMDTQQEINLKIKERLEKEKIEMAFPTQTIYLKK